jgi:hypothetical protein
MRAIFWKENPKGTSCFGYVGVNELGNVKMDRIGLGCEDMN